MTLRQWFASRLLVSRPSRRSHDRRRSFAPETLETRTLLTAGALDTSFDGDGYAQADFAARGEDARAVAVDAQGRTLAAGQITNTDGSSAFGIARFTESGALDSTFGSGGKVTVSFGSGTRAAATGVAVQADGKIVVSGLECVPVAVKGQTTYVYSIGLVRLNANGSLDTTFGDFVTTGKGTKAVTTQTGKTLTGISRGNVNALALQADGKILVGGSVTNGTDEDFLLARYTAAGALDTSFGGTGKVTTGFASGAYETGKSLALQADGTILFAGQTSVTGMTQGAVARYNADGSLDTSFGSGGRVTIAHPESSPFGANVHSLKIQPGTDAAHFRIILGGNARVNDAGSAMLAALLPDGTVDGSFGTGGFAIQGNWQPTGGTAVPFRQFRSIQVQADGKIVAAAWGGTSNTGFGLARFNADGTLDTGFADNGATFSETLNGSSTTVNAIALRSNGDIVAVGMWGTNSYGQDFLVARYLGDFTGGSSAAFLALGQFEAQSTDAMFAA